MVGVELEKTKKSYVYDTLKERIVKNELKPLEYLNEKHLALQLGTSKTPIREALQELGRNRFVTIIPNKGCFVTNISVEDIREIFELREIYECAAVRMAAERPESRGLSELLRDYEESLKDHRSTQERLIAGYQIHTAIVRSLGNSRLNEAYQTLQDHIVRIRVYFIHRYLNHRVKESEEEHRAILRAIVNGNPSEAEATMRHHLRNAQEFIRHYI